MLRRPSRLNYEIDFIKKLIIGRFVSDFTKDLLQKYFILTQGLSLVLTYKYIFY